jgi:aspartyl-tRNA(Asn)/glutamyl-tRNA(Gln) amidotransferase subunit B
LVLKSKSRTWTSFSAIQKKRSSMKLNDNRSCRSRRKIISKKPRLWEEGSQRTISMRVKEGASDYRYSEPDFYHPLKFPSEQLEAWKSGTPELPAAQNAIIMW